MNLWLAAAVAFLFSILGVFLGTLFSKLRTPYWAIGFLIALSLVLVYALAFHVPVLLFIPPFSWLLMGIKKFATLGFVATLVLTTPLSRVPQARNRKMILVLMGMVVFYFSIWPFLAAMMDRKELSRLKTKLDKDGICLQSTAYTCGPASAVTALQKLGLPAEEGQIGILSCTSDREGTPADMLAAGLEKEYGTHGLTVICRAFGSISELKQAGLTLAVIKYSLLEDHWVTVLDVTPSEVIVGDPLSGLTRVPHNEFRKKWRFIGIVLQHKDFSPSSTYFEK